MSANQLYGRDVCSPVGGGDACVVRPPMFEDGSPYALFLSTVEEQENGDWIVTDFRIEKLPEPPAPPEL